MTARVLRALRPYDSVGRYGGEVFIALITKAGEETAREVSERIGHQVACAPISHQQGAIDITVSVGVCSRSAGDPARSQELVDCADRALFAAKQGGRDRVESCGGSGDL